MTPSQAIADAVATAIADTILVQPADGAVVLVKEPFAPNESLALDDLSLADFTGSGAIVTGDPVWGFDPITAERIVNIPPPAGGFRWETTNTANLPQTIYGWAFYDADNGLIQGSQLLATPVVLSAANQPIEIPPVTFRLPPGFMQ